jgi:hypothetical protein
VKARSRLLQTSEPDRDRWGLPIRQSEPWDIEVDYSYPRVAAFSVTEGTWMNIDVGTFPSSSSSSSSSSSNTSNTSNTSYLVFDMLGDIYTSSLEGGTASLLLGGVAYEWQPQLSPDRRSLLYSSDRSGHDNLWVADIDCGGGGGTCTLSNQRPVSASTYRFINNGAWEDDNTVVGVKYVTSSRSLGAGEIWRWPVPAVGEAPSAGEMVLTNSPGTTLLQIGVEEVFNVLNS